MPLVRPVTVQEVARAPEAVQVKPPGLEVTVYPVMVEPPLETGAVQVTTDWALALEVADTPVGAPGGAIGVKAGELAEGRPVPDGLVAVTVTA